MFYVLFFMFYFLCFMFYILCFIFIKFNINCNRWGSEAQLTQLQEQQQLDNDEETEIMCMTFLEPYPTLVCGDSSGVLSFFSVRPSLFKNQLLLRVNVLSAVNSSSVSFTQVFLHFFPPLFVLIYFFVIFY
jgi:hypothetical protein